MGRSLDNQKSRLKSALLIAGVGVLYYCTARFGLRFSYEQSHESPVWPLAGLALAALLLLGWRVWPAIWIGAFSAAVVPFIQTQGTSSFTALWISAAFATGDTLEALAGWWLWLRWFGQFSRHGQGIVFLQGLDVFRFAAMSLVICIPSACLDSWVICTAGFEPWSKFFLIGAISWIGDASGILLLTPFLMAWAQPLEIQWSFARAVEGIAAFAVLAGSILAVFGGWLPARSLAYLTTLPVVWIAVRQGPRAVTSALVFLAASAIWFTVHQQGPFVFSIEHESILFLQIFLWVVALSCMVLASSVAAQRKSEAALMRLATGLEERVETRGAELKRTNAALRSALEKEVILRREINHRVKNNLQIIKSLLFLQASQIDDPMMRELLRESQSRIQSISLIYDKLSERSDVGGIVFVDYVQQLARQVFDAYRVGRETVALRIQAEEVFLDLDTAVPCGLILTELISNALKYAFPKGSKGELLIDLHSVAKGRLCLTVSDNGIGLPEGFKLGVAKSMGMGLLRDLTRQIDGQIEFISEQGTTAKIIFPCTTPPPKR